MVVTLGAASLLGCQQVDEFGCAVDSQWPGRPDCQPVGTTLVVVGVCDPPDPACVTTQTFDEVGESAWREVAYRD